MMNCGEAKACNAALPGKSLGVVAYDIAAGFDTDFDTGFGTVPPVDNNTVGCILGVGAACNIQLGCVHQPSFLLR